MRKKSEDIEQIICTYFTIPIQPTLYTSFLSTSRNSNTLNHQKEKHESSITVSEKSSEESPEESSEEGDDESSISISEKPRFNALAQKLALTKQKAAEKKLKELNNLHCIAQDLQLLAQAKCRAKKLKALEENNEVIHYDSPRWSSFLQQNPNLPMQLHSCIEFGSAMQKRKKEIIKVHTSLHLKAEMEERYKVYMSRSCLNTYLWPRCINSLSAKWHHHPIAIQVMSVSRNEMKEHIDEHYYDKAKVFLGITAVGWTFKTIQSDNEPVAVPNHDFPKNSIQKLIPSVYLTIDPKNSNDSLQKGQLLILIRTSSSTHMADILSLLENPDFDQALK
ncbi:2876_t:CDS:2 [Gigaspora margarita]|uniref:2876_t:CDS:1 n=1 Tax=Gigaspora margarita TaxID=4874 RepID=A0ABN7W878_GIGMA|nr:2876_t:CDS:2 [Gigaspora margarita]